MKMMFNSSNRHFLEFFSPEVVFEDDLFIAETPEYVLYFLEEFGLTKDDVKNAGLKIMKNKITLPKGTKAIIVANAFRGIESGAFETTLRVGSGENAIEFDHSITYEADGVIVDCVALDSSRENVFSKFGNGLPRKNDDTMLAGFYINDVIDAVNEIHYPNLSRQYAFEALKCMSNEEIASVVKRYFELIKLKEEKDGYTERYKLSADILRKVNNSFKK